MFHLTPNTQKCLKEDIQANQLVMGEYEVSDVPGQVIDYIVSIHIFLWRIKIIFSLKIYRLEIQKDTFSHRKNT